jgi:hypothetical protein
MVLGVLWPGQSDFFAILLCLVPANICYFILLHFSKRDTSIFFYMLLAISLRIGMLFSVPHLSDDYFRFIWDGHLSLKGVNPYEQRPVEQRSTLENAGEINLFSHLNSPQYHTVYPPFLQAIFRYSLRFADNKLVDEIFYLKIFYAFFSIGTVFLLPYLLTLYGISSRHAAIYLLNPLVIIEEMGNLHAEGILVFFLALFLLAIKKFPKLSFIPFSTAVVVKLTPFLLLPAIFFRLPFRKSISFGLGLLVLIFLCFLPYVHGILKGGFFESLFLYFHKLEFNAFGYNLFKALGYLTHGYNRINIMGPLTAMIATFFVLYVSFQMRKVSWDNFPLLSLMVYFIYLFFSPILHPWYIIPLVFFAVFTQVQFVIVWSALSLLSYSHYFGGLNREQYHLIFIEYAIVLIFLGKDVSAILKKYQRKTS